MDSSQSIMAMIGICVIFMVMLMLAKPLKILLKTSVWGVAGLLGIYILNFLTSSVGVVVGLNFFSWIVTGVLGVPGLMLLYGVSAVLK